MLSVAIHTAAALNLQSPGTISRVPTAGAQSPSSYEAMQCPPPRDEQPSTSPSPQTHPCRQGLSPSGHEVTIFDLGTLEPDVGTGFHHGPLYHPHEPSVDLTHLSRARGHK